VKIHRLQPSDAGAYRALMLEAYAAHPEAFTSSVAERAALPLSWWQTRLAEGDAANEVVFGASEGSALSGVAGLAFKTREKVRHKATLFGMYVPPAYRGQGLGRKLVTRALDYARHRAGMRIVQLTVTQGNGPAEALYARCGFIPFGIEPFAVALGTEFVAKVHMACVLDAHSAATETDQR
jgi:RimJ/RimL family protein N-acetyltransferase